ncbi:MAG TPA: PQQ-binding-like beta-propeller repeat protein [Pyrinomonadaceae bacterium]|nr:PQQ-binding-like beta-propeller repeat protein [Pyrinomonadaceae bacterium]
MLKGRLSPLRLKTICFSLLVALSLPAHAQPAPAAAKQANAAGQSAALLKLKWAAKPRVRRYRLQVALDEKFTDIVYDQAVVGLEQEVSGLQPGKYYWRVAPATPETGRYSAPVLVEALPPMAIVPPVPVAPAVLRPPANVGWQAAIGTVARPFAARLRAGKNFDLIATNSDGTVFALDGGDGSALWSARARATSAKATESEAKGKSGASVFVPLVLPAANESNAVVVLAFAEGVRAVDGETGRELWRTVLQGRMTSGALVPMQGDEAAPDFVVVSNDPDMLYVLDSKTGRVVSRTKLGGALIGAPIPFRHGDIFGVAYSLDNRQLDIRRRDGSAVRAIRFDVPFTTPPLILATPSATLVVIGTEHGLIFFEGSELKPLGRITTEKDAPRGRLNAADLDNDGTFEIVMVTQNGRVAVISAAGKVNWASEGASDAYMATFAHLNNDGVLDVVAPSAAAFAVGFSGRDGTRIWQADETKVTIPSSFHDVPLRTLTGAVSSTGTPLLVGGDMARSAVRAVGLPSMASNTSMK